MDDLSSLSSLSSLESIGNDYIAAHEANSIRGGKNYTCSLEEFDPKRAQQLSSEIQQFQNRMQAGSNKTNISGQNIEAVDGRQNLITSMALSGGGQQQTMKGGTNPQSFEPASFFQVGTKRLTNSGIFQVGWSWDRPNDPKCIPVKKWFPVTYSFRPLLSQFSYLNGYRFGIPSSCPMRLRYQYICPFGPSNTANTSNTNTTTKQSAANQPAAKTAQTAKSSNEPPAELGGGLSGGVYKGGPLDYNYHFLQGGSEDELIFKFKKDLKQAELQRDAYKSKVEVHDECCEKVLVMLSKECLERIKLGVTIFTNKQKMCNYILKAIEQLGQCKPSFHKVFVKCNINVILCKLYNENLCTTGELQQKLIALLEGK
tara:strand:+ start:13400 stop:14512 length:1113 start_codon:yes stop_codon:yes gene_type:complete